MEGRHPHADITDGQGWDGGTQRAMKPRTVTQPLQGPVELPRGDFLTAIWKQTGISYGKVRESGVLPKDGKLKCLQVMQSGVFLTSTIQKKPNTSHKCGLPMWLFIS
jgi:hypothetical protein